MSQVKLEGVIPVIPTPFRADETIDLTGVASCIEFAVQAGLGAVCLPAYASEFYKLAESERRQVIETALAAAGGRIAIVAQSNHPSARCAAELAAAHEQLGADVISFALPRQFAVPQADMLRYCETICRAVELPVLIQDFNPGGPTVDGVFARELNRRCPNFQYLKLEESLMAGKVRQIREKTDDTIGVLEGWGGMYTLELIPAGICGLIPGLGAADLLRRVWDLGRQGDLIAALDIFGILLPQLVFSLQNLELFLHLEKELLAERGILERESTYVRAPTWSPDQETLDYGLLLNRRVIAACEGL